MSSSSAAARLAWLARCGSRSSSIEHNARNPDSQLSKENIYVLEKAREIGQHCLSGALLDPRSMRELLPGFEKEAPLDAEVTKEAVYFLTQKGKFKFPITPPPLRDHGNYVISLNRFVKWLGGKVEETGITIFTGFAGSELLVRRRPRHRRPHRRQRRGQTEPAEIKLRARLRPASQDRHSRRRHARLADQATHREVSISISDRNPQTYGQGIKELWEVPAGRIAPGEVIYTMGWPLTTKEYGGAWIYGGKDNVVSLGFVTGLDYPDPRLDPQRVLQEFKKHPFVAKLARRRQDDPLRREVPALRRLVVDSAGRRRRLDDPRRLRRVPEFAAPERNSSRHQERHAGRRDCV